MSENYVKLLSWSEYNRERRRRRRQKLLTKMGSDFTKKDYESEDDNFKKYTIGKDVVVAAAKNYRIGRQFHEKM